MFEVTILATVVDVIVIIGLLYAKPSGRKLAIGGAVTGIVSYAIFFAIPGIVAFSILVWYMFRTRTKEYFKISNKSLYCICVVFEHTILSKYQIN